MLELLVALLIATLMLTLLPFARDRILPRRRLALATEHLVAILRTDRETAERDGKSFRLPVAADQAGAVNLPGVGSDTLVTWTPTEGATSDVRFYPDGSASPGHFTLSLGRSVSTVRVRALTGRIEVDP